VRPSRFHVLQNFTSPRALTRNITHSSHRVLDSQTSLAHGEHQRVCATPGWEPWQSDHVVKQRPGRTSGAGVHARERTNPVEGVTSRTEHCLGGFCRLWERSQVAKAPVGAPSGLRLRGKEP